MKRRQSLGIQDIFGKKDDEIDKSMNIASKNFNNDVQNELNKDIKVKNDD